MEGFTKDANKPALDIRGTLKRVSLANFLNQLDSPVLLTLTISCSFALLYKFILQYHLINFGNDSSTLRESISWLGIPYSILISMILLRAWERANEVSNRINREAHTIDILYESLRSIYLEPDQYLTGRRESIFDNMLAYIDCAREKEDRECEDISSRGDADKVLREIEKDLDLNFLYLSDSMKLKLPQKMTDIFDARKERLHVSKGRMPPLMWSLLLVASLSWLILFIFVSFNLPWLGFSLVFGIAFIVSTIVVAIVLFNGSTSARHVSDPWEKLRTKILLRGTSEGQA